MPLEKEHLEIVRTLEIFRKRAKKEGVIAGILGGLIGGFIAWFLPVVILAASTSAIGALFVILLIGGLGYDVRRGQNGFISRIVPTFFQELFYQTPSSIAVTRLAAIDSRSDEEDTSKTHYSEIELKALEIVRKRAKKEGMIAGILGGLVGGFINWFLPALILVVSSSAIGALFAILLIGGLGYDIQKGRDGFISRIMPTFLQRLFYRLPNSAPLDGNEPVLSNTESPSAHPYTPQYQDTNHAPDQGDDKHSENDKLRESQQIGLVLTSS